MITPSWPISNTKSSNPIEGSTYYESSTNTIYVFTANSWQKVKAEGPITCVKCHTQHDIDYSVGLDNLRLPQDHPIFKDNLQMLEWEEERHERFR